MSYDMTFKKNFSCLFVAPSQGGKTYYVRRFLSAMNQMCESPPTKILYHYKAWQPIYDKMKADSPIPMHFVNALPTEEFVQPLALEEQDRGGGLLICMDDFGEQITKFIADLFTVYCHHWGCSLLYLQQTFFSKSPFYRQITLNVKYIFFFNFPRDKTMIAHFARQFSPRNAEYVLGAYAQVTAEPYTPLMFDFTQTCPSHLRVRSRLLPDELMEVWWRAKPGQGGGGGAAAF